MTGESRGFVPLKSLRTGAPDPRQALADIRKIYFTTTRRTIQHDLAHAIELLKTIPTEEERDKARVYMDGLAQMRGEWTGKRGTRGKSGKVRSGKVEK
ncbi:MAG: hypothetical protein ACREF4_21310 [Gammaproteobacteria bacterium]